MSQERILIVEDEKAVAKGLRYGLQKEGYETLWADTGKKALEIIDIQSPHLILLDVRLPDISGFDVCRQLRSAGKHQPILMLTARDEEFDKVLGLELGADDYIVKPYSIREVVSRIRANLRRTYGELATPIGKEIVRFDEIEVDMKKMEVYRAGDPVSLTLTEFRVLRYLVNNPNTPCSRDAIIEGALGFDSDIENDRTIDVHIRHLREKLEDNPKDPRYLITVRGIGYKFQSSKFVM